VERIGETKLTKKDLKGPDTFVAGVETLWNRVQAYGNIVVIVVAALVVAVLGYSGWSWMKDKSEVKAQQAFFLIESELNKTRDGFDRATAQKVAFEKQSSEKKSDKKATDVAMQAKMPDMKDLPSKDFQKDFGAIAGKTQNFINENKNTNAAVMAALALSRVMRDYKEYDKAETLLSSVQSVPQKGEMFYGLLTFALGDAQEGKGDCEKAITNWKAVTAEKKIDYLHAEAWLRIGICYNTTNQPDKAIETFKKLSQDFKETRAGQAGKRYLKLLELSKSAG
jgi:predicted negative regulator of RcsB-dependent stress response